MVEEAVGVGQGWGPQLFSGALWVWKSCQPVASAVELKPRCLKTWTRRPHLVGDPSGRVPVPDSESQLSCPSFKLMQARQRPVTQHSFLTAGGWLIPGTSSLCPPATPHPQFGGPLSLPSTHGCERYPALRNHRPTPYPSPYAHRNNSPSKSCVGVGLGVGVDGSHRAGRHL